jgi:hypothetical protein
MFENIKPEISVIILSWNGLYLLKECLPSLEKQSFRRFETIVVDNGSTDGTADWLRAKYPAVKLLALGKNRGFCGGNNAGLSVAQGNYIALLNNDTEVEEHWLQELYNYIVERPNVAACDSRVYYWNERGTIWSKGADYSVAGSTAARCFGLEDGGADSEPEAVFTAVACAALYRISAIREIGFLDERFFAGYEDIDWSFRAHLSGYAIVNVPSAIVYHKVSATHRLNSDDYVYRSQRNNMFLYLKNMPFRLIVRYALERSIYLFGATLYFIKIGRGRACFRGHLAWILGVRGILKSRAEIQGKRRAKDEDIDRLLKKRWWAGKKAKYLESTGG